MGCELFSVLSGSMEPNYHVGSLIVVKKTDAGEVEVGDVITYVLNEDLVTVTHRVVEKLDEEQRFITKGDANEDIDAVKVHYNNLIGKPVIQIPKMGYVTVFLNTTKGKIIAGTVLIALCLIMFVPDMIGEDEENTKKGKGKEDEDENKQE